MQKKRIDPENMNKDSTSIADNDCFLLPKPIKFVINVLEINAQSNAPPFKSPVICAYPKGNANSQPNS